MLCAPGVTWFAGVCTESRRADPKVHYVTPHPGIYAYHLLETCHGISQKCTIFGKSDVKLTDFRHIGSFLLLCEYYSFPLLFRIFVNKMRPSWNDRIFKRFFRYSRDRLIGSKNRLHLHLWALQEAHFTEPFTASRVVFCIQWPSSTF